MKRRIQDVEKLMIEDEFMSFLICEICERETCFPKYCRSCEKCVSDITDGKLFKVHHSKKIF